MQITARTVKSNNFYVDPQSFEGQTKRNRTCRFIGYSNKLKMK